MAGDKDQCRGLLSAFGHGCVDTVVLCGDGARERKSTFLLHFICTHEIDQSLNFQIPPPSLGHVSKSTHLGNCV